MIAVSHGARVRGCEQMVTEVTLWEFRIHRDEVTRISANQAREYSPGTLNHIINCYTDQYKFENKGDTTLSVYTTDGQLMIDWPLEYGTEYPRFTEVECLMNGHRFIFEYRRRKIRE